MDRKKARKGIVEVKIDRLSKAVEKGFGAVAEDIENLRTELKGDIKKVDDRLTAVESKLGGIDNRIDNETFARKDLEVRVRKVVSNLPRSTERA
jgi:chromosome condensin MukBEF complex kleisin-like MukF subunit